MHTSSTLSCGGEWKSVTDPDSSHIRASESSYSRVAESALTESDTINKMLGLQ